jgi:hypothetical protein
MAGGTRDRSFERAGQGGQNAMKLEVKKIEAMKEFVAEYRPSLHARNKPGPVKMTNVPAQKANPMRSRQRTQLTSQVFEISCFKGQKTGLRG